MEDVVKQMMRRMTVLGIYSSELNSRLMKLEKIHSRVLATKATDAVDYRGG